IACHPDATPAVWRAVFPRIRRDLSSGAKAADALAARAAREADVALRKEILAGASWRGLAEAYDVLTPTQKKRLGEGILAAWSHEVIRWLKENDGPLPPEIASALLRHSSREVRLMAMTRLPDQQAMKPKRRKPAT